MIRGYASKKNVLIFIFYFVVRICVERVQTVGYLKSIKSRMMGREREVKRGGYKNISLAKEKCTFQN